MSTRILMFNKQASFYRASVAAQFHHKDRGMVQEMKVGSDYRSIGMIKGKTEKGYGKTLTTTSAYTTHTSSPYVKWTEKYTAYSTAFSAISAGFITMISLIYTVSNDYRENNRLEATKDGEMKLHKYTKDKEMIKESRARLRAAFSMSKKGDLLEQNRLMDIIDRVRTVDSVCVKCIHKVNEHKKLIGQDAPKDFEVSLKREVDTLGDYDVSLKKWVDDRKYNKLRDNKDMEVFRDFLLTLHEGAKTFKKMKQKAAKAGIDMDEIWGSFLNGSQEGKILLKVVLKFYNFYNPEEKEGVEYSRIVGDKALWDDALWSRRRYVRTCIGGSGYGDEEIASSSTGEENWNDMLDFLKEINPRFDDTKNPEFKYLAGPEPWPGKCSGSKDCQ